MGNFELDPNFKKNLLTSPAVGAVILDRTEAVAARAREHAPDDPDTPGSSVAEGIVAEIDKTPTRYVGRVNGFDFKTGWFEFGTARIRARRMLGRALEECVGPVEGDEEP